MAGAAVAVVVVVVAIRAVNVVAVVAVVAVAIAVVGVDHDVDVVVWMTGEPFYHPLDYTPCPWGHATPDGASFSCTECPEVWEWDDE